MGCDFYLILHAVLWMRIWRYIKPYVESGLQTLRSLLLRIKKKKKSYSKSVLYSSWLHLTEIWPLYKWNNEKNVFLSVNILHLFLFMSSNLICSVHMEKVGLECPVTHKSVYKWIATLCPTVLKHTDI